jgi:hypothetical protein
MRKLGGFTYTFAEITDKKSSEPGFPLVAEPDSTDNLSPWHEKVKSRSKES